MKLGCVKFGKPKGILVIKLILGSFVVCFFVSLALILTIFSLGSLSIWKCFDKLFDWFSNEVEELM